MNHVRTLSHTELARRITESLNELNRLRNAYRTNRDVNRDAALLADIKHEVSHYQVLAAEQNERINILLDIFQTTD